MSRNSRIPDTWKTDLVRWPVMLLGSAAIIVLVGIAVILWMDLVSWWAFQ